MIELTDKLYIISESDIKSFLDDHLYNIKITNKSDHTKTYDQMLNDDRTTTDNVRKGERYD